MALATTNTMFPVYVYEEGMDLPKEGTYYVVAGNGAWLHKDTGIVRCFVPVEQISILPDIVAETELQCNLPKIPARTVWRVKNFFHRVVEKHRAEAEINLYYNKTTQDYKVHIPEQIVSHGGVQYKRVGMTHVEGMEDYLRVGTIHSHCDFGAFHSGTDVHDENDFDGLHVTFGHNDQTVFTISASVVVNGERTKIDPLTVLEGIIPCGKEEWYTFNSVINDHDPDYHVWTDGLDKWMEAVRSNYYGNTNSNNGVSAGSMVTWVGDMMATHLKDVMGEGPFEVTFVSDDKVDIKTKIGVARLSSKLFRKASN
jgi:PRTRC genetic system protein A